MSRGDVSSCGKCKEDTLLMKWWWLLEKVLQRKTFNSSKAEPGPHHLYDVQAWLGVLQHRQLLIDVHEADLIWVGSLTHKIDDLLE